MSKNSRNAQGNSSRITQIGSTPSQSIGSQVLGKVVNAICVGPDVKLLLERILHALQNNKEEEIYLDNGIKVATKFDAKPVGRRRKRGWVIRLYIVENGAPYEIDVATPLTKKDIGWIAHEKNFILVGSRLIVAQRLIKMLKLPLQTVGIVKVV